MFRKESDSEAFERVMVEAHLTRKPGQVQGQVRLWRSRQAV